MTSIDSRAVEVVGTQPYPLLFLTVSGAHLYGFPSADSDVDLRGAHVLPVEEVVGLKTPRETIEGKEVRDGLEVEIVTHDVEKFFRLLLRKNGYVLEQLYSPLVVRTTPEHEELKRIARGCITRHHAHHYLGFSRNQWVLFEKDHPPRVKPLLYTYRVLLTGIHLMRTGEVNANLVELNGSFRLPYVPELIDRKQEGGERGVLSDADLEFHRGEFERLTVELETARDASSLPEAPSAQVALNDLLVRLRVGQLPSHGATYFRMASEIAVPAGTECPVCGLKAAFDEPGAYDICDRCGWEDDPVQRNNPDFPGGANQPSLNQARQAWRSGRGRD